MKKIIVTGGCGFVGHHFIEHMLVNTDWHIIVFDKMTYAANGLDRLRDIKAFDNERVITFTVDFTRPLSTGLFKECGDADVILHMGAETHVDRSISDPGLFVYSNVVGTYNLLEFARVISPEAFIYFSTDEVFGPAPEGVFYKEWDRYNCCNPYAATKAGAEQLTLSYMKTYKLKGFIVNCMNIFGERQHPEKFIPTIIRKVRHGEVITIHGTSDRKKSGSRFYIHARNVAAAIYWLISRFEQREKYNVVGEREFTNLLLAQTIADIMGQPLYYEIVDFHSSRPGHDLRYSLDGSKLEKMGYEIPVSIDKSLEKTVEWTLANDKWLYLQGGDSEINR